MSLPAAAETQALRGTAVDPFGLWQPPQVAAAPVGEAVSFGDLSGASTGDLPAAVWTLALDSGLAGQLAARETLQRRADQLNAIQEGLDAAGPRADRLLARRAVSGVSFTTGESGAEPLPEPEQSLSSVLDAWDAAAQPGGSSFGLGDELKKLPAADWDALRQRLEALLDGINRQLLHFVWVDTTIDGNLAARTTINWGGDLRTLWQADLSQGTTDAHQQSLGQALQSRQTHLRTILTVSQIAAKIALAVTTPLGPLQALSLAWQFVQDVIIPLMEPNP